ENPSGPGRILGRTRRSDQARDRAAGGPGVNPLDDLADPPRVDRPVAIAGDAEQPSEGGQEEDAADRHHSAELPPRTSPRAILQRGGPVAAHVEAPAQSSGRLPDDGGDLPLAHLGEVVHVETALVAEADLV